MEADSYRVSRIDNNWGFHRFTLFPKEKTPEDHYWYGISLCFFFCYDINTQLLRTEE